MRVRWGDDKGIFASALHGGCRRGRLIIPVSEVMAGDVESSIRGMHGRLAWI